MRNRKLFKETHDHYKGLPFIPLDDGVYENHLERTFNQLINLLSHQSRILIIRINFFKPSNPKFDMRRFIEEEVKYLRDKYEVTTRNTVAYTLAREVGGGDSVDDEARSDHYHLSLMVKRVSNRTTKQQREEITNRIKKRYEDEAVPLKDTYAIGFFELNRSELSKEKRASQKADIQRKIDIFNDKDTPNIGHHQLQIHLLALRNKNKGVAVGGVIDEAFYALSYLCKVAQKPNDEVKRFTASQVRLKPIEEWTSPSHETLKEFIEACDSH